VALLQTAGLSSALAGHGVYFPGDYSRGFFAWLRNKLVRRPGSVRKLYVRRPDDYDRRILNQAELEARLQAQGFEVLDPAAQDIAAQAEAFAGAHMVVCAWGSGLTLAPLLSGRRTVVELLPQTVTDPWFLRQAVVHGLDYRPIPHPATPQGDITADIDRIEHALADVEL
jgi:capsular polysaccharide biosynthesis protein